MFTAGASPKVAMSARYRRAQAKERASAAYPSRWRVRRYSIKVPVGDHTVAAKPAATPRLSTAAPERGASIANSEKRLPWVPGSHT
jgi:hypothetical protein